MEDQAGNQRLGFLVPMRFAGHARFIEHEGVGKGARVFGHIEAGQVELVERIEGGRGQAGPSTLLGHRFTVENCAAYRPDVMSALEWFGDRPLWNSSGWLRTIAN